MAAALVIQPLGLQVNDPNIQSLKDIKPTDRIAYRLGKHSAHATCNGRRKELEMLKHSITIS